MYRVHPSDLVHIDRYLLLRRSLRKPLSFQSSTYFLVPKELLVKLKNDHRLDIERDATIEIDASLFVENDGSREEVVVVYRFRKPPQLINKK